MSVPWLVAGAIRPHVGARKYKEVERGAERDSGDGPLARSRESRRHRDMLGQYDEER
jgi:hypothetical protein